MTSTVPGLSPLPTSPGASSSKVAPLPAAPAGSTVPGLKLQGANSWTSWEQDVLRKAGLPVTPQNVTFLANWHVHELSNATNNPLNTTAYAPIPATVGVSSLNAAGVQNYATPAQGAAATAAFLAMPNYTAVHAALKSGDPYSYATKSSSNLNTMVSQLATWGSRSFAAVFAYEQGGTAPPAAGDTVHQSNTNPETGASATSTTTGPKTPLDYIGGIEQWLVGKGKLVLAYLLLVGVAGGLLLTGMKGLGVATPKLPAPVIP